MGAGMKFAGLILFLVVAAPGASLAQTRLEEDKQLFEQCIISYMFSAGVKSTEEEKFAQFEKAEKTRELLYGVMSSMDYTESEIKENMDEIDDSIFGLGIEEEGADAHSKFCDFTLKF
jgi:hypothetical protein